MPRKGHSEEQIVYALRQVEGGKKVSEICRELGVSAQAFYSWKRRYAGLGLNELRELRQLREENRKLKSLVADLSLDRHILQEVLCKKSSKPAARRELVSEIRQAYQLSENCACGLVRITRWSNRYQSCRDSGDTRVLLSAINSPAGATLRRAGASVFSWPSRIFRPARPDRSARFVLPAAFRTLPSRSSLSQDHAYIPSGQTSRTRTRRCPWSHRRFSLDPPR